MLSAIAVTGDLMEPTLRDGDEILVGLRSTRPLRDGIHVVRLDDTLLVKQHRHRPRPGRIALGERQSCLSLRSRSRRRTLR